MIIYFTKSEANNNNALHWECIALGMQKLVQDYEKYKCMS